MPKSPTTSILQQAQPVAGAPLDYSFKELKTINDLLYEDPVSGFPTHRPISREDNATEYLDKIANETHAPQQPGAPPAAATTSAGGPPSPAAAALAARYNSNSIRLANNHLMTLQGLERVLFHVLDEPSELVWLDASCNQLASIEDVVLKFPKLQVLYLHGNTIANIHDVLKLQKLPHLTKLTLHGNPVSEQKNYKMWVAAHLPGLRSLDFSTITRVERDKINTWFAGYQKKLDARNK